MRLFSGGPETQAAIEEALDAMRYELWRGVLTPKEVQEHAEDTCFQFEYRSAVRNAVKAALRRELALKRKQEATWPNVTDCDRFDAAVASLEQERILVRPFFSCCPTCVYDDIEGELQNERKAGREPRAIFYFFPQDVSETLFKQGARVTLSGSRFDDTDDPEGIVSLARQKFTEAGLDTGAGPGITLAMHWQRRTPS